MPKPPGALTGDSSGSILDPNPCPSRRTMNQRRWRARRRGEYVPEGAFYPALTKAGRPRKGAPRPVFEPAAPTPKTNSPGDQPGPHLSSQPTPQCQEGE